MNNNYLDITNMTIQLELLYPRIAMYESRASLWNEGFNNGLVTEELYKKAKLYYGNLWTYVGD